MTELVSAMTYANTILSRIIRQIAATRIQKKWRSWKIEQMAEVERAQAKMHKIENLVGPSWKSKESDKIEDLLEGMDVIKDKTIPSVFCLERKYFHRRETDKQHGKEKEQQDLTC